MIETWKDVEGYSRYKVSNFGEVLDTKYNRLVAKQLAGVPQYYYVNMTRDDGERKLPRLHRLVAMAFVEGRSDKFDVVDHIDRDKFNNVWTNLRWVDYSGNQKNTGGAIFIEDIHILDYCEKFDNTRQAYSFIQPKLRAGMLLSGVEVEYRALETYGRSRKQVLFNGEPVYLMDLCSKYSLDYKSASVAVADMQESWEYVMNIPSFHYSFELPSKSATGYWIPSKKYLEEWVGKELTLALKTLSTYEDIIAYDSLDYMRVTVLGVAGTIPELCKHFDINEQTVNDRRRLRGWSLEKALTEPYSRVKFANIDGVSNSLKAWFEHFGLDYKRVKKYRGRTKSDFESTLNHFGIDTSSMEISYGK